MAFLVYQLQEGSHVLLTIGKVRLIWSQENIDLLFYRRVCTKLELSYGGY